MVPKVGDTIYVPTRWYISRGTDDILGGKATVTDVEQKSYGLVITVAEIPNHGFIWKTLENQQEKLRAEYGDRTARVDPDYGTTS
jgi:hypothetical protein